MFPTRSTWSPARSVPARTWFGSAATWIARSVPFSCARTPSSFAFPNRRVETCSPASTWSTVTSRAIWAGLEIAPGTSALRGTDSVFSMCPDRICVPDVPAGMSVAATSTPTVCAPCWTCLR